MDTNLFPNIIDGEDVSALKKSEINTIRKVDNTMDVNMIANAIYNNTFRIILFL